MPNDLNQNQAISFSKSVRLDPTRPSKYNWICLSHNKVLSIYTIMLNIDQCLQWRCSFSSKW